MAEIQPIRVPFSNKGLVQRKDAALLEQGEFSDLRNMMSVQDGALSVRLGSIRKTGATAIGSRIHTLDKFSLSSALASQYLYIGEGTSIYRLRADFSMGTLAEMATGVQPFQAHGYHAGATGKPFFFIAAGTKMLKDTGSLSTLQRWGILPPTRPALAAVQTATPVAMTLTGNQLVLTIGAGDTGTYKDASQNHDVDWSRGGIAIEPYFDSEDPIRATVAITNVSALSDIRIAFSVHDTSFTDYYEKPISISTLQNYVAQAETAYQNAQKQYNEWLYRQQGGYYGYNPYQGNYNIQPYELPPLPESGGTVDSVIPKKDFVRIGKAGKSGYSWANVKAIRIQAKASAACSITLTTVQLEGGTGPNSQESGRLPYVYRYTFRNPVTGVESNPSVEMISDNAADPKRQSVQITFCGTDDSQVPTNGDGTVAIYRQGGAFADGLYRLVGYGKNPGLGSATTFTDAVSDADLAYSPRTLELDNDPPIRSTLPQPFLGTITNISNVAGNLYDLTLSVQQPSGVSDIGSILTRGSELLVDQGGLQENCIIEAIDHLVVRVAFQKTHATTAPVMATSVVGAPCKFVCQLGDSLFAAGDANNPHTLYKSKTGRPESWPVVNLTTGITHQMNVGSPSNPIMAITDFSDGVLVFCRNSVYYVGVYLSQMRPPAPTPAQRGLLGSRAWCKADNEIWYLGYDGVYSWSGGESKLRSHKIDWVFKGQTVNGLKPVNVSTIPGTGSSGTLSAADEIRFYHHNNKIRIVCKDTDGSPLLLVCDLSSGEDVWSIDTPGIEGATAAEYTAFLSERDTGRLISAKRRTESGDYNCYLYQEEISANGDSDGTSAFAIPWAVETGYFSTRDQNAQLADIVLDLNNPNDAVTLKLYYDFSASVDETLTIPAHSGRRRYIVPVKLNDGVTEGREAYAVKMRFEGSTASGLTLHSATLRPIPLAPVQRGMAYDWTDGGYHHDKRLEQLVIEYDAKGQTITLNLDTLSGISGATKTNGAATFTLSGSGRVATTLPIKAASGGGTLVAKRMRLRPATPSAEFEIFRYDFLSQQYPPDITCFTEPSDCGYTHDKYFQQLLLDVDTGGVAAAVVVEVDGVGVQTLSVNTTATTRRANITLNPGIKGRKVRLLITPGTGGKFQLFSHDFVVDKADRGPVIHTHDWDLLGHPYDKRLLSCTLEYEVTSPATVNIDILSGVSSSQSTSTVKTISLTSEGRRIETVALPPNTIAKAVRLYPTATNADFKAWSYNFEKILYPPDVVAETDQKDFGTPYEKYFQQLVLDVDTGGIQAVVTLNVDGSPVETLTINTTAATRKFVATLFAGIKGKKAHLTATVGVGGKFQLFDWDCVTMKADRGPVEHTFDWDDLGYQFDKRLKSITVEYDTGGDAVSMQMDTLSGIDGTTQNLDVARFELSGLGRSLQTFILPDNTIAKMVRIHPVGSVLAAAFKVWKYTFDKVTYPADKIVATDPDGLGYPFEKVLRSLTLEVDTGGVAASVAIQADGVTAFTATITTTATDRARTITAPSDVIGKLFRIVPTPGIGGKFQLFSLSWNAIKEPPPLTHWDSLELIYGSDGYHCMKQVWIEYMCPSPITVTILRDGGQTLVTKTLPAHSTRSVERFYVPVANGSVMNKSKGYRIKIDSTTENTFKMYRDGSRIEIRDLNDQRAGYSQKYIYTNQPGPEA